MAHQIEVRDVFGEVRARGERAWHGLGVEIPVGLTAEEGFKKIGLDWGTKLLPMQARDGDKLIEVPDAFLHVRDDTSDPLGVVGPDYRPIANMEMARFGDALVGADATVQVETAGSLRNGRRVFCCVKLPKTIEVVNQDILELYVVLSNSHDGSAAFHIYPTSIRVVCANTLGWSEKDLGRGLRLQHTGKIDDKIKKAQQVLGLVVHEVERFKEEVEVVRNLKLTKQQAREYFFAIYAKVFGAIKDASGKVVVPTDGTVLGEESLSTREKHREKIVARWMELLDDPRQTIPGIQGTGWAVYNAFSQWSDHERGNTRGVLNPDTRVHSNLFGISQLTKKRAWQTALQMA